MTSIDERCFRGRHHIDYIATYCIGHCATAKRPTNINQQKKIFYRRVVDLFSHLGEFRLYAGSTLFRRRQEVMVRL